MINVLIGLTQLPDKLVFVEYLLSLRASALKWRGNPPVRGEMYRQLPYGAGNLAIFGDNRNLVPLNRGIATTSVRTGLAMTGIWRQPDKHQFTIPGEKVNIWILFLRGKPGQAEEGHGVVVVGQLVIEIAVLVKLLRGDHVGLVAQLTDL